MKEKLNKKQLRMRVRALRFAIDALESSRREYVKQLGEIAKKEAIVKADKFNKVVIREMAK